MKLNPMIKRALAVTTVLVLGFSCFLAVTAATGLDARVQGHGWGWSSAKDAPDYAVYYMDGSTTVALTLIEGRTHDYNIIGSIWYETASDVWRQPTADVTLKDSDSDGYTDWLGFTATGGDTAGGEVRIYGVTVDGLPGI